MSEALQKIEQPPAPVIQSEGAALISMIERAAQRLLTESREGRLKLA